MLLWFCQDALVLQRICEGGEGIKEAEIETNKENIPNDVVDVDIALLEKFFAKDTWRAVQHAAKLIRNYPVILEIFAVVNNSRSKETAKIKHAKI